VEGNLAGSTLAGPALIAHLRHHKHPQGASSTAIRPGFETRNCWRTTRPRAAAASPAPRSVGSLVGNAWRLPHPYSRRAIDLCDVWDPGKVPQDSSSVTGLSSARTANFVHQRVTLPTAPQNMWSLHDRWTGARRPAAVTRRLADLGRFVSAITAAVEHRPHRFLSPSAPEDKRLYTDGKPRPAVEIRLAPKARDTAVARPCVLDYTDTERTCQGHSTRTLVPHRPIDVGVLDRDGITPHDHDRKADASSEAE